MSPTKVVLPDLNSYLSADFWHKKMTLKTQKSCWNSNLKRFLTLRQGNPSDPHLGGRHCTDCDIWRGMAGWGLYCLEFPSGFWKEQTNWDALENKIGFLFDCMLDYWDKLNSYVLVIYGFEMKILTKLKIWNKYETWNKNWKSLERTKKIQNFKETRKTLCLCMIFSWRPFLAKN